MLRAEIKSALLSAGTATGAFLLTGASIVVGLILAWY